MALPTAKIEIGSAYTYTATATSLVLDNVTTGRLDNIYTVADYTTSATWSDVTSKVQSFSTSRGKSRQLDKFEAGTASVTFNNYDRAFDPLYTSSPYYGQIVPKRPIRIWSNYASVGSSTRTNKIPNSNMETSLYWGFTNVTAMSTDYGVKYIGGASQKVTVNGVGAAQVYAQGGTSGRIPVSPSTGHVAAFYIRDLSTSQTFTAKIAWYNASNALISTVTGTATAVTTTSWTRVTAFGTAPATAATAIVSINTVGTPTASTQFYMDAVMFVPGTSNPGIYFDYQTIPYATWVTYSSTGTGASLSSTETIAAHTTGQVFTGFIDDWNLDYNISGESTATCTATDAFGLFANEALPAQNMISQTSGERITYVLNQPNVQFPTDWRFIDSASNMSMFTMGADSISDNTNVLDYLQLIEQTENGKMFIDKSGDIRFRGHFDTNSSSGTVTPIADDGTGLPYTDIQVVYGSELLYNRVNLTDYLDNSVTLDDTASQTDYGLYIYSASGLLCNSTADLSSLATLILDEFSQPEYRFGSVTINMTSLTAAQQAQVIALELGDEVTIVYTPNKIGTAITSTLKVMSIANSATPSDWNVTLGFEAY